MLYSNFIILEYIFDMFFLTYIFIYIYIYIIFILYIYYIYYIYILYIFILYIIYILYILYIYFFFLSLFLPISIKFMAHEVRTCGGVPSTEVSNRTSQRHDSALTLDAGIAGARIMKLGVLTPLTSIILVISTINHSFQIYVI